ncbi:polysaccharide biosynthesis protein [Thiomicrorhabdus lithotrophica]|uniref:Polysaccharide biosynthesis protein n=1 Tax=Thiomicrorhabdus lithotrophica TaxID=2949997 RepID=A0ABY8CD52_9GAMM|nr:nucleoside-diphosphate sugar epimerase/dehydratase [Thiomicrorhabdus lithotrophica]WEJ63152.1 polysaccharide biosynthesis protein [Thiomicrorhabdus lithotrophica]
MFGLDWLVPLPRWQKRAVSIIVDFFSLIAIALIAVWLRLGNIDLPQQFALSILILPFLALPAFIKLGLYRAVVRYISHRFMFTVFTAVSLSFLIWSTAILMFDLDYPRSALIIAWLMAILYITGSRLVIRWFLLRRSGFKNESDSIVIFGASDAGRQLMNGLVGVAHKKVVAFIDDDKSLYEQKIGAIKVYRREDLEELIQRFKVKEILLASPGMSSKERQAVLTWLTPFPIKVSTLPSMEEIVDGKVSFSDIREVSIEDLLGRDTVPAREKLLSQCITDKTVMVTGGGGSIGSELCRQILKNKPKQLIVYELSEFALYNIEQELEDMTRNLSYSVDLIFFLGDVKNRKKLEEVIIQFSVNTIYHAAAYKHVPLVEHNISEGINNNSFGTMTVAEVAAELKVQNFVLVSTDKAVRPTNFMGASKRLAELSLQALQDEYSNTRFVMVRFGNVLGSSGSVIPLFKQQIANGGPVTVTHKEITRYFMTIPEAASLVIQAGSMGTGGDVFVLDMGEPVKIADLAEKLIKLSGLEVVDSEGHGDIEIQYTGLRPGEKLYEELLIGDNVDGTDHPRIMKAHEDYISYQELKSEFDQLHSDLKNHNYLAVSDKLSKLVSGFKHSSGIVDYIQEK